MDGTELSPETRKKVVEAIQKRLNTKIKFRGQIHTLSDIIKNQAILIAKFIEGKSIYKPFFDRW